jgi:hypothetical protein
MERLKRTAGGDPEQRFRTRAIELSYGRLAVCTSGIRPARPRIRPPSLVSSGTRVRPVSTFPQKVVNPYRLNLPKDE